MHYNKNTLSWWYMFVIVGHDFSHAFTSMTILWQNQDSHTCVVIEVFHDSTKIIITEVFTSMTINDVSWKCFRQGWPTRGIHHNGSPLSYRIPVWIRKPVNSPDQWRFSMCKILIRRRTTCQLSVGTDVNHPFDKNRQWNVDMWDGPIEAHIGLKASPGIGPQDFVRSNGPAR